jgi:hypothetical protein
MVGISDCKSSPRLVVPGAKRQLSRNQFERAATFTEPSQHANSLLARNVLRPFHPVAAAASNQRSQGNFLVEILRHLRQHARIGQLQQSITLREHS